MPGRGDPHPALSDAPADEVRAVAFGWLARPAELLQLLLEHQTPEPSETDETPADDSESGTEPSRATAFPTDLLATLRHVDLRPLAPKTVLHVHLHQDAITSRTGVARVEGLGPVTLTQLRELLARTHLTVRPVLDLSNRVRTTAYEHPESLKHHVHLITGGDYWPYATSTSRHLDYDHPTPYDHHTGDTGPPGRPGQTGTHNSDPLGRRHHRWKTHAGYRSRQSGTGRYVWITPHGLAFLVDHQGTHPIDRARAEMIYHAPPGVDIYPAQI